MKFTTHRITGLLYLGLAVTGMYAFLAARSNLYIEGDALQTYTNLVGKETLARAGIAVELALVAFQALTAVWFFKLFRSESSFGAGLIAAFGMVNATAILISSAFWLSALNAALGGGAEQAATAQLLFSIHDSIWLVASLFFGMWLIPMGYMVRLSGMPRMLSWFLIAGGIGYILSTLILIVAPDLKSPAELLPLPATVGEFWTIGYLLFKQPPGITKD